jgi:hypothetical protein
VEVMCFYLFSFIHHSWSLSWMFWWEGLSEKLVAMPYNVSLVYFRWS